MANKRKRDDKLEIKNNKKKGPTDLTSSEYSSEDSSEDVIGLTGDPIEINQPARSRKTVDNTIERKQALTDLTIIKANANG
jgi:hypothetical protein